MSRLGVVTLESQENHSFLKMPGNWEQWPERWSAITTHGSIWTHLKNLVAEGASLACFQNLKQDLSKWRPWCSGAGIDHQWEFSAALLDTASFAAGHSTLKTESIERKCFDLLSPWQWDAFCFLLSVPRIRIPETVYNLTVLSERNGEGCMAVLEVELVPNGTGAIYLDPERHGFHKFEEDFLTGTDRVWRMVKHQVSHRAPIQSENLSCGGLGHYQGLDTIDARFRLHPVRLRTCFDLLSESLGGRSAEAAFFLVLLQAANSYFGIDEAMLLDQTVAVSATVQDDVGLGSVTGLYAKLEAACRKELALVIVSESDRAEADQALAAAKAKARHDKETFSTEIVGLSSIAATVSLLRERVREKEVVRAYEKRECRHIHFIGGASRLRMAQHYFSLPMLLRLPSENLNRDRDASRAEGSRERGLTFDSCPTEACWGKAPFVAENVRFKRIPLENIFSDFTKILDLAGKKGAGDVPRFAVTGGAGSGKSTLIQHLAGLAASDGLFTPGRHIIPARIMLRQWEKKNHLKIWAFLAEAYENTHPAAAPRGVHWRQWLERGEVLLLLDGLDEIRYDPDFWNSIKEALNAYRRCPTVLTCRSGGSEPYNSLCPDFPVFTLGTLDLRHQSSFIKNFSSPAGCDPEALIQHLVASSHLQALASNPLLLNIICFVALQEKGYAAYPASRGVIYDRAIDLLFAVHRKAEIEYPEHVFPAQKRRMLEMAALELFLAAERSDNLNLNEKKFINALKRGAESEKFKNTGSIAASLLEDLIRNSGILTIDSNKHYAFVHLNLQEFLAAGALSNMVNDADAGWASPFHLDDQRQTVRDFVDRKSWDARWHDVIVFMAGLLEDASPLLDLLADEERDDYFRHRLALSARCLSELPPDASVLHAIRVEDITNSLIERVWQAKKAGTESVVGHLVHALPSVCPLNGIFKGEPWWRWLVKQLKRQEGEDREAAIWLLGILGVNASVAPILDVLSDMLASEDACERHAGAAAFEAMGPPSATDQALDDLTRILVEKDEAKRLTAMKAIRAMGPSAARAPLLPVVAGMLKDRNLDRCLEAVWTIEAMGASVFDENLILVFQELLGSHESSIRSAAARALKLVGSPKVMTLISDALNKMLNGRDDGLLQSALKIIELIGSAAAEDEILMNLIARLERADTESREALQRAFQAMGSSAATPYVLDELARMMESNDATLRKTALRIIASMGPAASNERVLCSLAGMLPSRDWEIRSAATYAIKTLCPEVFPENMLSVLVSMLASSEEEEKYTALEVIESMGLSAAVSPIVEMLTEMASAQGKSVPEAAARALRTIGPNASAGRLRMLLENMLSSKNIQHQKSAARRIAALGPLASATGIMSGLAEMLLKNEGAAWASAVDTLEAIGPAAAHEPVLEMLPEMLNSGEPEKQEAALNLICALGSPAATEQILARLAIMLRSKSAGDRKVAIAAIEAIGPAAAIPPMLKVIAQTLRGSAWDEKEAVLRAINAMGASAATDQILSILMDIFAGKEDYERRIVTPVLRTLMAQGVRIFQGARGKIIGRRIR